MHFFVTGANGAGKTACMPELARLLPNFTIHDFAEVGVPANRDARWRQETTEFWVRTYLEKCQAQGRHWVICGGAVFGDVAGKHKWYFMKKGLCCWRPDGKKSFQTVCGSAAPQRT